MKKVHGFIVVLVGSLYFFYDSILIVLPSAVLNDLMFKFSIDATGVSGLSAIYFYTYAPLQIIVGLLINKFGVKKIIIVGLLICMLGLLFFRLSDTFLLGCISRGLMGIGASAGYIAPMILIVNWFDKKYYVILIGLLVCIECLGAIFGQTGLIMLTKLCGLEHMIEILIIMGCLLSLLTLLIIKDFPNEISSSVLDIKEIEVTQIIQFIKDPFYIKMAFCSTLLWSPIAIFASLWGINFIHILYDVSNLSAAHLLVFVWSGIGVGSLIIGFLTYIFKEKLILILIFALLGCVTSLNLILGIKYYSVQVAGLLLCIGLSSSAQILVFGLIRDKVDIKKAAVVFGFNNMFICFGNAIFQGVAGFLLDLHANNKIIKNGIHVYSISDYRFMMFLMPTCYLIVLLIFLFEKFKFSVVSLRIKEH